MTAPDPRHVADLALKIIDTVTGHDSNVVISALVTTITGINSHFSNDRDDELRNAAVITQAIMAAIETHRDDTLDDQVH